MSLNNLHNLKSIAIMRLGTGFRINAAKGDAAGLAITDGMVSQVRALTQARRNANDGISLAQTTEGAMSGITNQLQRMRELLIIAQNWKNGQNLAATQEELSRCAGEITRISTEISFNNLALSSGTADSVIFQTGAMDGQDITLALPKVDATALGVDKLDVSSTRTPTEADLERIGSAIDRINSLRATLGETQGRLQSVAANLNARIANTVEPLGLVEDTDSAAETANSASGTILQQAGIATLAQANLPPAGLLALLPKYAQETSIIDTTDDRRGSVAAQGENGDECKENLFDNQADSKWLDFSPQGSWIQYSYAAGIGGRLTGYTLTSANDCPERDPSDWQLLGSNDGGASWDTLDTQAGVNFDKRFQKRSFALSGTPSYKAYRLNITKVADPSCASSVQLAEMELLGQQVSA